MIRVLTQALLGFMLLFGVVTLLPRALMYWRHGQRGRGALYLALGIAAGFFCIMSFGYAWMQYTGG